jgi:hypothetical protein
LKKDFANSKLKSVDADPEQWLTELESLSSEMKDGGIGGRTIDDPPDAADFWCNFSIVATLSDPNR